MKVVTISLVLSLVALLTTLSFAGAEKPENPGNNNSDHKVWICHVPPGNPENAHAIHVDANGWNGHDNHTGDFEISGEFDPACGGATEEETPVPTAPPAQTPAPTAPPAETPVATQPPVVVNPTAPVVNPTPSAPAVTPVTPQATPDQSVPDETATAAVELPTQSSVTQDQEAVPTAPTVSSLPSTGSGTTVLGTPLYAVFVGIAFILLSTAYILKRE